MSDTPEPQPVDPTSEPEQIQPSATGLVVPDDDTSNGSDEDAAPESATDPAV